MDLSLIMDKIFNGVYARGFTSFDGWPKNGLIGLIDVMEKKSGLQSKKNCHKDKTGNKTPPLI